MLLAKTIDDIVTAFAFPDSENGTASLLTQLFTFVMTVPRERRAVSQRGHCLQDSSLVQLERLEKFKQQQG